MIIKIATCFKTVNNFAVLNIIRKVHATGKSKKVYKNSSLVTSACKYLDINKIKCDELNFQLITLWSVYP